MTKQGRGSAGSAAMAMMIILMINHQVQTALCATTYSVGDSGGWTFTSSNWPKGKRFAAGDVLLFNYDPTIHNVVAVGKGGYGGCTAPANAKVYQTGKDRITLARGQNYFICSIPGHCQSGMKIAINAA